MPKNNKIRRSLKYSFWDGVCASVMIGLTQDYLVPYALALKATLKQIGLLSSLPNLGAALIQLKSADITERLLSRKKITLISVFLQALILVPILFIPYFSKDNKPLILVFLVVLFSGFGALSLGPWSSWMSEHVPHNKRGEYFGWRNRILGAVAVISALFAGIILQFHRDNVLSGFLIILIFAMAARFLSWYFLTRMYEPRFRHSHDDKFSFWDFLRRSRESNFARFVFFVAGLNFCVNLAAPFFAVFMLKDLRFSYLTYTILIITVPVTTLLLIRRWGRLADRVGNIRVLKFCACFIAGLPIPWLICRHPLFLGLVQILGGFAWSGFNLCVINFIFDSVSPAKRTRCFSYFNVINGLFICSGALIGGYLAAHAPRLWGYQLLSLFLFSSVMRFLTVGILSPKIKEVRLNVEVIKSPGIFKRILWK